ncbi:MAG: CHAP domain-containing protein [Pedobacter sp.]|nr:MAG: CHAP domain-containing protein [Pedobacter sp.]
MVKTYESKIGVRELTGRNDGREVETYLSYVWLKRGQPWCAAFVSWTLGQNGIKHARSGGCVQLMEQGLTIYQPSNSKLSRTGTKTPQAADVFFIYFPEKKRVAHTGFVHQWGETTVITVEGNTNEAGSREGDGVYRKRRLKRQIYAVTTYIK